VVIVWHSRPGVGYAFLMNECNQQPELVIELKQKVLCYGS
jgi:hypothetical protein